MWIIAIHALIGFLVPVQLRVWRVSELFGVHPLIRSRVESVLMATTIREGVYNGRG